MFAIANFLLLYQLEFAIANNFYYSRAKGGVCLNIGKNIKEYRLKKGWTLAKLSSASGVSKPYLSQIENTPDKQISAEKLYQIAQALEVTMGQLMGKEVVLKQHAEVPSSLLAFAEKNGLQEEQIQMLANIKYRGQQPSSEKEWETIYLAIKSSIQRNGDV